MAQCWPSGGPVSGGTLLQVHADDARLLMFSRAFATPTCRFASADGASPLVPAAAGTTAGASLVTPATIDPDGAVLCRSPGVMGSADAEVELSLNGQHYSASVQPVRFRFYTTAERGVRSIRPTGGPVEGGTNVTVRTSGLEDLGGVACRFTRRCVTGRGCSLCAARTLDVAATLQSASLVTCTAPSVLALLRSPTCEGGGVSLSAETDAATLGDAALYHVEVSPGSSCPHLFPLLPAD